MFRRVLVATDLSDNAATALAAARRLAPDAALRLVHVAPAGSGLHALGDDLAPFADVLRRTADDARTALQDLARSAGAEVAVLTGSVAAEIAADASSWGADLVVVGARGHSRVRDLLLGSVARAVLRRVKTSVLVVRSDAPVRVVAAGTDFSEPAAKALAAARALAEAAGASLVLFHAADPAIWGEAEGVRARAPAGARDRTAVEAALRRRVEAMLPPGARAVVESGRPVETGALVARDVGADLLVLGDHGPGAMERALLGSVAEGLAERAPCSVLVAR